MRNDSKLTLAMGTLLFSFAFACLFRRTQPPLAVPSLVQIQDDFAQSVPPPIPFPEMVMHSEPVQPALLESVDQLVTYEIQPRQKMDVVRLIPSETVQELASKSPENHPTQKSIPESDTSSTAESQKTRRPRLIELVVPTEVQQLPVIDFSRTAPADVGTRLFATGTNPSLQNREQRETQAGSNQNFDGRESVERVDLPKPGSAVAGSTHSGASVGDSSVAGSATVYVVQKGDSLSLIAEQQLGSRSRYMEIFNANRDQMSTPDQLRVGMRLIIPTASTHGSAVSLPLQQISTPVVREPVLYHIAVPVYELPYRIQ